MKGEPANSPRTRIAKFVTTAENSRHVEQYLQGYNYELVDRGKTPQERENFWKQALSLFQNLGFDLQANSEIKQAAAKTMERLAETVEPAVRLSIFLQFTDTAGTVQSVLEDFSYRLNENTRDRGIGHVEDGTTQENGGTLQFWAYQEKDVFDKTNLDRDVPTLVDILNLHDRVASFVIHRLANGNETRLYYTEPEFPKNSYQKYGTHDGFCLEGRYVPEQPNHSRAEFHVFASKVEEGHKIGFTQKAEIARVDVHHMPEGEIEGRLSELAHRKVVRRIQTDAFEYDGLYSDRYGSPAMKHYKIKYQPLNSKGQAGPMVASTTVHASDKANAIIVFLDEIPDAYSEKEIVMNSRKVDLSHEEARRVKEAGIRFVDTGGSNEAVIEGVEQVPKEL